MNAEKEKLKFRCILDLNGKPNPDFIYFYQTKPPRFESATLPVRIPLLSCSELCSKTAGLCSTALEVGDVASTRLVKESIFITEIA